MADNTAIFSVVVRITVSQWAGQVSWCMD